MATVNLKTTADTNTLRKTAKRKTAIENAERHRKNCKNFPHTCKHGENCEFKHEWSRLQDIADKEISTNKGEVQQDIELGAAHIVDNVEAAFPAGDIELEVATGLDEEELEVAPDIDRVGHKAIPSDEDNVHADNPPLEPFVLYHLLPFDQRRPHKGDLITYHNEWDDLWLDAKVTSSQGEDERHSLQNHNPTGISTIASTSIKSGPLIPVSIYGRPYLHLHVALPHIAMELYGLAFEATQWFIIFISQ